MTAPCSFSVSNYPIIIHCYGIDEEWKPFVDAVILHPHEKPQLTIPIEKKNYKKWLFMSKPQLHVHIPHVIVCSTMEQLIWIQTNYMNVSVFPFLIYQSSSSSSSSSGDDDNDDKMIKFNPSLSLPDLFWKRKEIPSENADHDISIWMQWWNTYEYVNTMNYVKTNLMAIQEGVKFTTSEHLSHCLRSIENGKYKDILLHFATEKCETVQQLDLLYWYIRVIMEMEAYPFVTFITSETPVRKCILKTLQTHDFEKRTKRLQKWIDLLFMLPPVHRQTSNIQAWVINLKHRQDLRVAILRQLQSLPIDITVHFPEAVFGYEAVQELHDGLHKSYSKAFPAITEKSHPPLDLGEWGCYLTHIRIWEQISKLPDNSPGKLIIENRAVLGSVFARDWPTVEDVLASCGELIDLLWVGYHIENHTRAEMILDTRVSQSAPVHLKLYPIQVTQQCKIREDSPMRVPISVPLPIVTGGTFGYYTTPRACRKKIQALLETETPILYPLDVWMMRHLPPTIIQYALYRPLLWSSYLSKGGDIRSHKRNNH